MCFSPPHWSPILLREKLKLLQRLQYSMVRLPLSWFHLLVPFLAPSAPATNVPMFVPWKLCPGYLYQLRYFFHRQSHSQILHHFWSLCSNDTFTITILLNIATYSTSTLALQIPLTPVYFYSFHRTCHFLGYYVAY